MCSKHAAQLIYLSIEGEVPGNYIGATETIKVSFCVQFVIARHDRPKFFFSVSSDKKKLN